MKKKAKEVSKQRSARGVAGKPVWGKLDLAGQVVPTKLVGEIHVVINGQSIAIPCSFSQT